uniref:Uncharacterized protein n=1 Tax=Trichogramma kaykai TaxID=54128 RepID=A0ABD2W5N3_9HYME
MGQAVLRQVGNSKAHIYTRVLAAQLSGPKANWDDKPLICPNCGISTDENGPRIYEAYDNYRSFEPAYDEDEDEQDLEVI